MKKIKGSKIVGTVQFGSRTISITRDGKMHISDGTGPVPTAEEVIRAVRTETSARRAQANEQRATATLMRIGKFKN